MTGQADRAERQATGALKEKGAAALERAWKFVQENASETGILYARVVLRDRPVEDAIAAFAAHQLADGSHPATGSASDVDRLGAIGRAMAPCIQQPRVSAAPPWEGRQWEAYPERVPQLLD